MKTFRSWLERIAAAAGLIPAVLFYTRKSTEDKERQVASHDQQKEAILAKFGVFDDNWWFADSRSGTTFERDQFSQLRDFCRANRRPKSDPGIIYIYDPSRFGRVLDEEGKPDILAFLSMYGEFESAGWQLHFVTVNRVGDNLADIVTMALYAYAAAIYSTNLSNNVKRGMGNHASQGWWTGGAAPWGTKRMDTRTGKILSKGQQSTPGGGGTVLVADQPVLDRWKACANRILAGASLDDVGDMLTESGVRGPRQGKLGHRSIKNFLTNPGLVGLVEYTPAGQKNAVRVEAKWEPLVDVDLFRAVEKELEQRNRQPRNAKRKKRGGFPLKPGCAHCGGEYHGGRLAEAQGRSRSYVHTKPKKRMDPEAHQRFLECGCKVWYVDAEELENGIKDLIAAERGSVEFEDLVRQAILERDEFRKQADQAVASAKAEVVRLERQNDTIARSLAVLSADENFDIEAFEKEARPVQQKLTAARTALKDAEKFARSRENAWDRLSTIISETRNLAEAWPNLGEEERKILLDYWIYDVQIIVEPVPGKLRANTKSAAVVLRTAPNDPKFFALDRQAAVAANNSSSTHASVSTDACADNADLASAEPTLPRAQAACARTNGSGSDNARESTATAAGEPQLPSPTHTLRANPALPERRIADPRENESHSVSSSAVSSNSMSDGDEVPGCDLDAPASSCTPNGASPGSREANAGSAEGRENLRVYGHTS
jgi:DNA invertase Pin-like site-specific DNA recombinase